MANGTPMHETRRIVGGIASLEVVPRRLMEEPMMGGWKLTPEERKRFERALEKATKEEKKSEAS